MRQVTVDLLISPSDEGLLSKIKQRYAESYDPEGNALRSVLAYGFTILKEREKILASGLEMERGGA